MTWTIAPQPVQPTVVEPVIGQATPRAGRRVSFNLRCGSCRKEIKPGHPYAVYGSGRTKRYRCAVCAVDMEHFCPLVVAVPKDESPSWQRVLPLRPAPEVPPISLRTFFSTGRTEPAAPARPSSSGSRRAAVAAHRRSR